MQGNILLRLLYIQSSASRNPSIPSELALTITEASII